ncbi:hypothetical protein [Mariniphaga sp.]|uniref:hypothetical protein n=1 Tax=Mariniphaga sp. TaxID=1954475 RepID=UPI003562527A
MLKHGANFFQELFKTSAGLQPGVMCKKRNKRSRLEAGFLFERWFEFFTMLKLGANFSQYLFKTSARLQPGVLLSKSNKYQPASSRLFV